MKNGARAVADNWHKQLRAALEGTKAYSLHMRLSRVRDVSQAHDKPMDIKMPGSQKSEKVRKMSTELGNLFQADGLEPYHTVNPEG